MASRQMSAIQKQSVFDVVIVLCILKLVAPHELVDDGLGLFGEWLEDGGM